MSTPASGFNIGKCHERKLRGQWMVDSVDRGDCSIKYADYINHAKTRTVKKLLDEVDAANVFIYRFGSTLCDSEKCQTKIDDIILYRDTGHLSVGGSVIYAKKFRFYRALDRLAN